MDKKKRPAKNESTGAEVGITGRKQLEEELRDSETKFRNIIEHSGDMFYMFDLGARPLYLSPHAIDMLGYTFDEFFQIKWTDHLTDSPVNRAALASTVAAIKTGQKQPPYPIEFRKKDGSRLSAEINESPLKDPDGKVTGLVGVMRDTSERKKAEEALKASEEKFRSIAEQSADVVWTTDETGTITFLSPETLNLFGYKPEEMVGRNFTEFLTPESIEAAMGAFAQTFSGQIEGGIVELKMKRKDGSQFLGELRGGLLKYGNSRETAGIIRDITGRRQVEQALRESEEQLRATLENAPDGIYMNDFEGNFLYGNHRCEEIIGYKREELIGKNFLEMNILPEGSLTMAMQLLQDNINGKSTGPDELELVSKDGRHVPVEINTSIIKWAGKQVVLAFVRDVTERQKAEEALRGSEERFRNMANLLPQTIFETDEKSNFIFVNRQGFEVFGYSEADVAAGMSVLETIIPQDRDRAVENISLRIRGKESPPQQYTAVRKDGSKFPATIYAAPIIINSSYAGMRGMLIDITESKRAEEALRSSEEKYRMVVENAMEAIAIAENGVFIFANLKSTDLFGYPQQDIVSRSFIEFIHPDDRAMMAERHLQRLKGEDIPGTYSCRIICKSGDIKWVEINATLITWEGRPAILIFLTDITDRRRLEEERQRVAKLESVGVLAGGIAHDFNNILTSIVGNISLARMEAAPGSELQNSLEQAEKASLRAKDLTKQLLTFSRGGAPVRKLASLTELLRDTAGFALRGSNVKCNFSIPADLWHAEIDAGQVSQVIHNLIINAQQAMPTGGTIWLTAENMTLSETQSLGKGLPIKAGDYIRIAVVDHGTGIPAEHLEKIFDPFFSTKQKGSGLGLATSFSIARQHGGHISVESETGSGSTFYLYLPASRETATLKPAKKEAIKRAGKVRILVMDDEQGVREIADRMLQRLGYQDVVLAADGAEAIKLYKAAMKSGSPFTVAILDLTIAGGMGGQETVRKLLKINPGVKAIVSSGYIDDSIVAKYKDYGFSGMVAKPYTLAELGKALNDVIG